MYETVMDKLTEQNQKLKEWIRTKKQLEKEAKYTRVLVEDDTNTTLIDFPETTNNSQ